MHTARHLQKFSRDDDVVRSILDHLDAAFARIVLGPGVAGQPVTLITAMACTCSSKLLGTLGSIHPD